MPLEPKLAPCGWRCPHRRPALTGPFGNCVIVIVLYYKQMVATPEIPCPEGQRLLLHQDGAATMPAIDQP